MCDCFYIFIRIFNSFLLFWCSERKHIDNYRLFFMSFSQTVHIEKRYISCIHLRLLYRDVSISKFLCIIRYLIYHPRICVRYLALGSVEKTLIVANFIVHLHSSAWKCWQSTKANFGVYTKHTLHAGIVIWLIKTLYSRAKLLCIQNAPYNFYKWRPFRLRHSNVNICFHIITPVKFNIYWIYGDYVN